MYIRSLFFLLVTILFSCEEEKKRDMVFKAIDAINSGVDFSNSITENDSINIIDFQYCYNGGGVGIGDFNNDGLPDIVFTGNQVSSRLYLNIGELKFEDLTSASKIETNSWITGVSIIDINADGWDDIYYNVGGPNCKNDCNNLLYINQGLGSNGLITFEEKAKAYGLDDGHYSQQTIFFDYDQDDDLDAFIVRNGNSKFSKNTPVPKRYLPNTLTDKLLRNDTVEGLEHPFFTDVSKDSGIIHKGFGLGVGINDFNNDGLTDVYVSNDFMTEDLLYINQDVTVGFSEQSKQYVSHETYNAMGVDIADINNDNLSDILVLDMLPYDYKRQKMMLGVMNYDKYLLSKSNDYTSQYMHNTLQINNGNVNNNPVKYSEVGFLKGLSSTDWSWAPLIIDMDNDGFKDIYITNGYAKDITDLDFVNFSEQNNIFGTPEARQNKLKRLVENIPTIKVPNFLYKQEANTTFIDVSDYWMVSEPTLSNGAAYADLDQDGDLDLIVNNLNDKASILENLTNNNPQKRYLRIKLKGHKINNNAIGAKVTIWKNGNSQFQFQSVIRGYLSSVEPILHFGMTNNVVDSIQVTWPNGNISNIKDVKTNQLLAIDINESIKSSKQKLEKETLFNVLESTIDYTHKENTSNDYIAQHLLVKQYSQNGPCLASANIDGKSGDELFIGGSKGQPGQIWFQDTSGSYLISQQLDEAYEDSGAIFFDADNDSDLDLYVTSGADNVNDDKLLLQDRLYFNDGNGKFSIKEEALPKLNQNTSVVRPVDIDKDGDFDLFVGYKSLLGYYPSLPANHILINNNGVFSSQSESGIFSGMVSDASWNDIDNDGWEDLIVVGEWLPITIYKNNKGTLEPMPISWLDAENTEVATEGWWNSVEVADFDKDGDLDMLLGNQGLNGFVKPSKAYPIHVYKKDFDQNGSLDPVLGQYFEMDGALKLLPVQTRDDIFKQLSILKNSYLTYDEFSKVDYQKLLNIQDLNDDTLKASTFASIYAENLGNGKFRIKELPEACQVAPVKDILTYDFDGDGHLDALLVGNDYTSETHYGRFDALTGTYLKGLGNGEFKVIASKDSGFYVPGQSNGIIKLNDKNDSTRVFVGQNNDRIKIFNIEKQVE